MPKRAKRKLKGSLLWPLSYAAESLRKDRFRNLGITLVLAIGVALPTTVFVWSETGTALVVRDFFEENSYHLRFEQAAGYERNYQRLLRASTYTSESEFIEVSHLVASAIGILRADHIFPWVNYRLTDANYGRIIKDCRVVLVEDTALQLWSEEMEWEGNFFISPGEVLVSQQFLSYANEVYSMDIGLGSEIAIDILSQAAPTSFFVPPAPAEQLGVIPVYNVTIAGVFSIKGRSLLANSFISMKRVNYLFDIPREVLGLSDCVIMRQDEIAEEDLERVLRNSQFLPKVLTRASYEELVTAGPLEVDEHLIQLMEQTMDAYPDVLITGIREIENLRRAVETFVQGKILTLLGLPILLMSLVLSIYTSETSFNRREVEIRTLRSKGASYNQVLSSYVSEGVFLALLSLALAIILSILMAPLMGASRSFLVVDNGLYMEYLSNIVIPPLSLVIAGVIVFFLPASYMFHVTRRVSVFEVGQPATEIVDSDVEVSSENYFLYLGLISLMFAIGGLIVMSRHTGTLALVEVIASTIILFVITYFGAKAIQLITSKVSLGAEFILGQKSLYISQSLRRRRRQFIPLLVTLTLTLTTMTMLAIQVSSFSATLDFELDYALGADIRVETSGKPYTFNRTLLQYKGVFEVTPVIEVPAWIESNFFFLEGITPVSYLRTGIFNTDGFASGSPDEVLDDLSSTKNGIVISTYYSAIWNKSMGDIVNISFPIGSYLSQAEFEIVGLMHSAPGFGVASTESHAAPSFASEFGFQVGQGGFALVNLNYLISISMVDTAPLFFINTIDYYDTTALMRFLDTAVNVTAYTSETFDIATDSPRINLYLSGVYGFSLIGFIYCTVLGISAIVFFLGSAVLERRHEYAIIRAIGGSRRHIVSMVLNEFAGLVISTTVISTVLGTFFGYLMTTLAFGISPFLPVNPYILAMPLTLLGILLVTEALVLIACCYIPASRAAKTDPAVTLRNL